jgi:hypothetical protein
VCHNVYTETVQIFYLRILLFHIKGVQKLPDQTLQCGCLVHVVVSSISLGFFCQSVHFINKKLVISAGV